MNETTIQNLREKRPHGTVLFPCAVYRCFGSEGSLRVKPHWHEEIEILYFMKVLFHFIKKNNINLIKVLF